MNVSCNVSHTGLFDNVVDVDDVDDVDANYFPAQAVRTLFSNERRRQGETLGSISWSVTVNCTMTANYFPAQAQVSNGQRCEDRRLGRVAGT